MTNGDKNIEYMIWGIKELKDSYELHGCSWAKEILDNMLKFVNKIEEVKKYKLFIRKYDIKVNDYVVVEKIIETKDLYHEIGKIYCQSIEEIKRIDYKELKE
ncbi:MAG: hypothetical protein IKK84_00360 [Clostridia bacterium]|nr:hypothetical protein [Clostridia bacterium]